MEIVNIIPQPNGGRLIIFDDGSQRFEGPVIHMEGDPGRQREARGVEESLPSVQTPFRPLLVEEAPRPQPEARRRRVEERARSVQIPFRPLRVEETPPPQPEARGLGPRLPPGAIGQRVARANNPHDLAWLRSEIEQGNITRGSRPIRAAPVDQFIMITEHDGWAYMIGRRTGRTIAQRIQGRIRTTPLMAPERYVWGVRGSSAARTAWYRNYLRAGGLPEPFVPRDVIHSLADNGVPPEAPFHNRFTGELSLNDIPAMVMELSQAALQSQESIRRYTNRFVARYNDEPLLGPVVGILAGILEFGTRLLTDLVGIPASLEQLTREIGPIFQAMQQAIPEIWRGLQEAPVETVSVIILAIREAIVALTGLGEIQNELHASVEVAQEGRNAESSLHVIRATGRVIELVLIVKGLVLALRRLPTVVASMRQRLRHLNQVASRLRGLRQRLRAGSQATNTIRPTQATRGERSNGSPNEQPTRSTRQSPNGTLHGNQATRNRSRPRERESDHTTTDNDLNVDEALNENAEFGPRETLNPDNSGHVRLQRPDGTPTRLERERRALHQLQNQILTREQLRAAQRFVGQRLNRQIQNVWRGVINELDRQDLNEVRRLRRRAERERNPAVQRALREGAYEIARSYLYPRVAVRFWNTILRTPRLAHIFRSAGLTLRRNRVPAWVLPDGTEVRLSLEHLTRVSDNPLLAIDPRNLSIVPLAENSDLLEEIRAIRRFTQFITSE